jgi:hypothetical protein
MYWALLLRNVPELIVGFIETLVEDFPPQSRFLGVSSMQGNQ